MSPQQTTLSGLVVVAQLLLAFSARAQPAPELAYDAPSDCPDERAFKSAVSARGPMPTHDPRRFDVKIVQHDAGFAGTLRVHSPDSEDALREVSGASCAEVFNALAVVTAIWLQPDSKEEVSPPTPAAAPQTAAASPPAHKTVDEAKGSDGILTFNEVHKDFQVEAGTVRVTQTNNVAVRAGLAFFGETVPRYDVTLDGTSFIEAPGAAPARTSPILRYRASFYGPFSSSADGLKSSRYAYSGAVAVCLSPYYNTHGFVFLACAELALGNLHESLENAAQGSKSTKNALFGSVGSELVGRYNFGGSVFVELGLSVAAVTQPAQDTLGNMWLGLGLGLQFD